MDLKQLNSLISLTVFIIMLPVFYAVAQNDTLAIVNGEPITNNDFINRFELSVYPGKGLNANLYKEKKGFLYSLIAEKLLSNENSISEKDSDPDEILLKDEIESIFLRDALYRKEVLSKVKVTRKELERGIKLSSYNYIVDAFYFPDSIWAHSFYNKIENKTPKYIYHIADSLNLCHDTLEIGYGESNKTIENAFFNHKVGYNSKPTNTIDGWVIFRIIEKKLNTKYSAQPLEKRSLMVHDVIAKRKGFKIGYEYLEAVMKGITVNVNYRIFTPLVYKIKSILSTNKPFSYDQGYYLSREEIVNLKKNFSFDPRAPMLRFKGGELTLGYIFDNLPLAGFAPYDTSVQEITFSLHSALRFIVQNYFLAKRAKKLGLQASSEVKYNTRMFLDAFRSNRLANEIVDTVKVTGDETEKFFEKHSDEVLKNVALRVQIFTLDNIDEAAKILNKLEKEKYSLQDTTGAVWIHAYQLREIGAVIAELNKGDIYGPLFIKGKFTIFRLLDKRSQITEKEISNSIQAAKEMLLNQRRREVLNKYLAKLAAGQSTKIFVSNLKKVNVTPIQMFTYRYIGFGGKIVAVPSLYPREDWVRYLKNNKTIFP